MIAVSRAVGVTAALAAVTLSACSSGASSPRATGTGTSPASNSHTPSARPSQVVGAASPADAAKQFEAAFLHGDTVTSARMACRHGWTGGRGLNVGAPAGHYVLRARASKVRDGWTVVVTASADGASSAGAYRVVQQGGRYVVCGVRASPR
jgi:hypothetical protein